MIGSALGAFGAKSRKRWIEWALRELEIGESSRAKGEQLIGGSWMAKSIVSYGVCVISDFVVGSRMAMAFDLSRVSL